MSRLCSACHQQIADGRLAALPSATLCTSCVERSGDVERTIGFLSWEHKTAPTLITSAEVGQEAIRNLHRLSRKGNHASLPLVGKGVAERATSFLLSSNHSHSPLTRGQSGNESDATRITNVVPAHCHPDRPAVANRKCLECCLNWYAMRLR